MIAHIRDMGRYRPQRSGANSYAGEVTRVAPMCTTQPTWRGLMRKALTVLGVFAAVAAGGSSADARSRHVDQGAQPMRAAAFDGPWSVLIQTERGACDPAYRLGLRIVNGAITYDGNPYGHVSQSGAVRVTVNMGSQQAQGVGRLSRMLGQGVWHGFGNAGACSGRWIAERRG